MWKNHRLAVMQAAATIALAARAAESPAYVDLTPAAKKLTRERRCRHCRALISTGRHCEPCQRKGKKA